MKTKLTLRCFLILHSAFCLPAFAQGTAFTYQGRLNDGADPASGIYDLRFALFDAATLGAQQGNLLTQSATAVSNGLFTVLLDFGSQFSGADRWLEIGVRTNGGGAFNTLAPRQRITPAPYALYAPSAGIATTAGTASSVSAGNITGTLPVRLLPSSVVTNGQSDVNLTGTFSGSGTALTNLDVRTLVERVGLVAAWGNSGSGQTIVPAGLSNVVAIAGGDSHSLALRSAGTVAAWGNNGFGQTSVPAGLSGVTAISAGWFHSLAMKSDTTVIAWGRNNEGQTNVPPGLSNVVAIAGSGYHCLALRSGGTVVAWGRNNQGQTNVPAGLSDVAAIAGGAYHSLALQSNGTVVAWGDNSFGQINVPAGLGNAVAIAGGNAHSLALKSDGTVLAWGANNSGQTTVPSGLSNVVAIAGGGDHSLALRMDGTVVAWGRNTQGQTSIPVGLSNVVAIAGGGGHSLALRLQYAAAPIALLTENNTFSGTITAVGFNGNGAGLTNLNADNLAGGLVPDAQLSANIARTNQVWLLGGNSGTTPGTHFLGTTDNQPLEIKVNGQRVLRLEPQNSSPNVLGGYSGNFIAAGLSASTIGGGGRLNFSNSILASAGTIAGGVGHEIGTNAGYSTVGGGSDNDIAAEAGFATITGGMGNHIGTRANYGWIGGGVLNAIADDSTYGSMGGGYANRISNGSSYASMVGGSLNDIGTNSHRSSIGGGYDNNIADNSESSTIAGGYANDLGATSAYGAIGGGYNNNIEFNSESSTIAGGYSNDIGLSSPYGAIGGGLDNNIAVYASCATIAGGNYNSIGMNAPHAVIGGGLGNTLAAGAIYATIPGGTANFATNHAFAAGTRAKANHTGSFVWSDSTLGDFSSTARNQFSIRATGGLRLDNSTSQSFGNSTRQMLNLYNEAYGIGVQNFAQYFRTDAGGGFYWYAGGMHNDANGNGGGGDTLMSLSGNGLTVGTASSWPQIYAFQENPADFARLRLGVTGFPQWDIAVQPSVTPDLRFWNGSANVMVLSHGGNLTITGTYNSGSDRNTKENFKPVDARAVLEKVSALSLSEWNYRTDSGSRHIGPMAQDFFAAFGVGTDDKHIATVDADGVALAAIQGLNQKLEHRLAEKEAEITELKQRMQKLEQLVNHTLTADKR